MRHNPLSGLLLVVGLILGLGGVAPLPTPRAEAAPADRWATDQFFRIDAKTYQKKNGQPAVWGYVYNIGRQNARVRLEIEGLDAHGNVVGTQPGYVDDVVPFSGRAYFDVPVKIPGAVTYRPYVLWYDWIEQNRGDFAGHLRVR